jgi:hypothetical protein
MLRQELKESDIPGRTTIRAHIDKVQDEHLKNLEKDLKASPYDKYYSTEY